MFEKLQKYWKLYAIGVVIVGIFTWVYTQGGIDIDNENRWFSTEELRYETEEYIKTKPSPVQEMRAYILDSLDKTSRIKSRRQRDSTLFEEIKARKIEAAARKITDSFVKLNADQMYQIKEILKKKGDTIQ